MTIEMVQNTVAMERVKSFLHYGTQVGLWSLKSESEAITPQFKNRRVNMVKLPQLLHY